MRDDVLIDQIQFLKTLSFKKLLNGFLLRLSYFITKYTGIYVHWGNPEFLSIEPTNLCNLGCPECPSGTNNLNRPRLFLNISEYKKTIHKVSSHLSNLQLFFQGEPFMHPKIYSFIDYAVSNKIYTSISTNGQFLTQKNCRNIISSGLQRIIISLDGTSQGIYEKYRTGGSLNKVIQGITDLNNLKTEYSSKTPFIILQFVVFKHNEHQIPDIKQLAKQLQVQLQIKSAQINNNKKENSLLPNNLLYSRYKPNNNGEFILKRNTKFKCRRIWLGGVISAEHQLLPCCFDKEAKHAYNEIGEGYFNWKSNKAKKFRQQVWTYAPHIDICKNCSEGVQTIIKNA